MANIKNINYSITNEIGNPLIEGFVWTGTIYGVDLDVAPAQSLPTSISATVGDLTVSFTPNATNGYKVYESTSDGHHYVTWRSQNIATQYPDSGYSLDIWSVPMYDDIILPGTTWQLLTENDPYNLSNFKYTLFYSYSPPTNPTAVAWCRGGKINFEAVNP